MKTHPANKEESKREKKREADREELAHPMSAAPDAVAPGKRKRLREKVGGASEGDEIEAEALEDVLPSPSPSLPIPAAEERSDPEPVTAPGEASAPKEEDGERVADWEEGAPNKWNK